LIIKKLFRDPFWHFQLIKPDFSKGTISRLSNTFNLHKERQISSKLVALNCKNISWDQIKQKLMRASDW